MHQLQVDTKTQCEFRRENVNLGVKMGMSHRDPTHILVTYVKVTLQKEYISH